MLARTLTAEADRKAVTDIIEKTFEPYGDLVQFVRRGGGYSEHSCDDCDFLLNAYLSLHGETKGYTTVPEAESEYDIFHPNCIHTLRITDGVLKQYEYLKVYIPKDIQFKYGYKDYQEKADIVINNAMNNRNMVSWARIGEVQEKVINEAAINQIDISNYKYNIDTSGVAHTFDEHGVGKEKFKNQIPVTDADIKIIPNIVYDYDDIIFGQIDNKGTPLIEFIKTQNNVEYHYLAEIRTGRKTLTLKTMYKKSR